MITLRQHKVAAGTMAAIIVIAMAAAPVSAAASAPLAILRPSHTISRQWTGTAGDAAKAIDDPVTRPTAVDATDYIYGSVDGNVTQIAIGDHAIGSHTASITVWLYANTGGRTTLQVTAGPTNGPAAWASATVPPGTAFKWHSFSVPNLSQSALDDLTLRFTVNGGGDSNIRAAYVEITTFAVLPRATTPHEGWAARSQELAYRWAPYLLQDTDDSHPSGDYLSTVDFDNNWRTFDNWDNQTKYPLVGAAYYAVAETPTHWFITYAYYHPRDWAQRCDVACVGGFYHLDEHENDMEGVLLVIRRGPLDDPDGSLQAAITVAHHDFYSYVPAGSPLQNGAEDIDGALSVAPMFTLGGFLPTIQQIGERRPWILQEAKTHAIHAWQRQRLPFGNTPLFPGDDGVIYWPADVGSVPSSGNDLHAQYSLIDMWAPDGLWAHRDCQGTFHSYGVFRGDNGENNKASAPWWWDDHSDALPRGALVTDPARLVANYFQNTGPLSLTYTQLGKDDSNPTTCD